MGAATAQRLQNVGKGSKCRPAETARIRHMAPQPTIVFTKPAEIGKGAVFVFVGEDLALSEAGRAVDRGDVVARALAAADFKGKLGGVAEVLAPAGSPLARLAVVGVGKASGLGEYSFMKLGGVVASQLRRDVAVTVVLDLAGREITAPEAADFAAGLLLRSYVFDKYKTRKDDADERKREPARVTIQVQNPAAAKKAFVDAQAVVNGVVMARDLVNEPANTLGPVEFAQQVKGLEPLGLEIEILTEREMRKLGMGSLLGVAQGSVRPPRLAVMRWNGGKAREKPVAFVGKGVVFDSGGVSIKPAAGMEDMRGDMAGAAAVVGVMRTIAERKAKVNVVGIIGCVENMVDGNAQRPGDIVTSMSGQTIEVINTDAEGRLVLADAMWYCEERFKPSAMIDLATLTGAVIVSLGHQHAGLFSNDDELAERLSAAGKATQERVWRMPLGSDYDKLIDTKNADMKNTGGRHAGAISAAQFLQRFVRDAAWAHLDIAGTAMGAPATEICHSWASGYGVRLLDRLLRDNYEG
jgi:leucyl aminopeptidase